MQHVSVAIVVGLPLPLSPFQFVIRLHIRVAEADLAWPGEDATSTEFERAKPGVCTKPSDAIDLEVPFCVQACAPTLLALTDALRCVLQPAADSPLGDRAEAVSLALLQLLHANFVRLLYAHVNPADVGIICNSAPSTLCHLLDVLTQVRSMCCRIGIVPCCV